MSMCLCLSGAGDVFEFTYIDCCYWICKFVIDNWLMIIVGWSAPLRGMHHIVHGHALCGDSITTMEETIL